MWKQTTSIVLVTQGQGPRNEAYMHAKTILHSEKQGFEVIHHLPLCSGQMTVCTQVAKLEQTIEQQKQSETFTGQEVTEAEAMLRGQCSGVRRRVGTEH